MIVKILLIFVSNKTRHAVQAFCTAHPVGFFFEFSFGFLGYTMACAKILRGLFYFLFIPFWKYKYVVYLCGNKIRKMKKETEIPDALNLEYLYQTTAADLLCKIVSGEVDPVVLAKKELANRGLDASGKWVGFDEAAKIHEV